ncbi:MAG: hypothetical protein KKA73_28120 [Chloroflexi bacterium]|nr:hypothetical protein [Chloroflexota bacterium]MBU1751562.1 hypothetical protein [Chloroflexota bacterium]
MKIKYRSVFTVCVALGVLMCLMLIAADTTYASLDVVNVMKTWDYASGANMYANGLQVIPQDGQFDGSGGWQSFFAELQPSGEVWPDDFLGGPLPPGDVYNPCYPVAPTESTSTPWASYVEVGAYMTDTTGEWGFMFYGGSGKGGSPFKVYECDRDGDNEYTEGATGDDAVAPPTYWITEVTWCDARVINVNVEVDPPPSGPSGNVWYEVTAELILNCDQDCDGNADGPWPNSNICLYWEVQRPPKGYPQWQGNMQARITAGTGEKTVNFSTPYSPTTSVFLEFMGGSSTTAPYVAVVLGLSICGVVLLYWNARRKTLS